MLSSPSSLHSASLASTALNSYFSHTWIIDTGTMNHMCCFLKFFISYKSCRIPLLVQLPNGTIAFALIQERFIFHQIFYQIIFFYIPSFKFNLLLVSQLTKSIKFNLLLVSQLTKSNRYHVIFSFDSCEFQDLYTKKKIGKGKLHEDPFLHTISSPTWLQHMRLILGIGHLATLLLAIQNYIPNIIL